MSDAFLLCEVEEDDNAVKDDETDIEIIECGFGDWDKEEKEACFDFVYPITVSFSDGSTKSIANKDELWKAKKACKKEWQECGTGK